MKNIAQQEDKGQFENVEELDFSDDIKHCAMYSGIKS